MEMKKSIELAVIGSVLLEVGFSGAETVYQSVQQIERTLTSQNHWILQENTRILSDEERDADTLKLVGLMIDLNGFRLVVNTPLYMEDCIVEGDGQLANFPSSLTLDDSIPPGNGGCACFVHDYSPTFIGVTFSGNQNALCTSGVCNANIINCHFQNCSGAAINAYNTSGTPHFSGNTASGCGWNSIFYSEDWVAGQTYTFEWNPISYSLYSFSGVMTASGNVTFAPGTTLEMPLDRDNGGIQVTGTLVADYVTFTAPGNSQSGSITFSGISSSGSLLTNCTINGIGREQAGAVRALNGTAPQIANCNFMNIAYPGVIVDASSSPTIVGCSFPMNSTGVSAASRTLPPVMAENNDWGHPSGPRHSSNPCGQGAIVSDYVDFVPWTGMQGSGSGFEILGAFTEDIYYTPGETAHVSVTTRNNECPTTAVRLVVETRSQGVPGLDDYFQVADVQFDLPQSPTPHQSELSWIVPSIFFPSNVGVRATLSRVADGQQLAQQWFPSVYTVSLLSHEDWQGILDYVENCAPTGFDCVTGIIGGVASEVSPYMTAAQFMNSMCVARKQWDSGDQLMGILTFGDGVLGAYSFGLEVLFGLPTNALYEGMRVGVDCAFDALDNQLANERSADENYAQILGDQLTLLPDSISDFRNHLIVQGNGRLKVALNDTIFSNLDTARIRDGFVLSMPARSIQWAYLGPEATRAGDPDATNPLHVCEFKYSSAAVETTNVSLVHRDFENAKIHFCWNSVEVDSGATFRIPASDTTDCIKMFLDQDGDGEYEQVVYPEVGGAAMQLVALVDGDSVRLNWNSVYCASSYRVYWGTSPDVVPNLLLETGDTTCADAMLDSVRFYHVTALFPE